MASATKSKPWAERKDQCKPNVQAALDANDMEALERHLPPIQKSFCEEYIKDFNGTKACERSLSETVHPEKMAYIWLANPGVRRYIEHLTAERTARLKVDQGYVLKKIIDGIEKAEEQGNTAGVFRGAELLAKHLDMFKEKIEITGKDGGAIEYEKIVNDAESFTRSIASIASRGTADKGAGETQH